MLAKTTTLFDYQEETIASIQQHYEGNRGVIIALGPGLGKTLISLLAARWITTREAAFGQRPAPIFVVSEVSPLQDWLTACAKHFDPPLVVECLGSRAKKKEAAALKSWYVLQKADVIISSYEMLVQFHMKSSTPRLPLSGTTNGTQIIYSAQRWPVFIFDEVHIIRNETTQVHTAVKDVDARYRIGLSGSPCNNGAADVLAIHRGLHICSSEHGASSDVVNEEFRRACQRSIFGWGASETMSARQHYQPTDIVIRHDFDSDEERKAYSSLYDHHVLTKIIRERQFCSGVDGQSKTKARMLYNYIEKVVLPRREKIVVLCEFRSSVLVLHNDLQMLFAKSLRVYKADGHTSSAERSKIREQFKNAIGSAALISTSIFEQGVNLEEANHIVRFDKWWNPVPEEQGRSRIERPGQRRSVFSVLLLVENTIEDGIWLLAQKKKEIIDRILQGEFISPELSSPSSSSSLEENNMLESRALVGSLSHEAIAATCDIYISDTQNLEELVPVTKVLARHASIRESEAHSLLARPRDRSWHVKVGDMTSSSSKPLSVIKRMRRYHKPDDTPYEIGSVPVVDVCKRSRQ